MSKAFHSWRLKLNFYATNYQNGISRKFFDQPTMTKMILRHTLIFSQNSWVTTLKMSSQNCMKHLRHFFDSPLLQPLTQKVGYFDRRKIREFSKKEGQPILFQCYQLKISKMLKFMRTFNLDFHQHRNSLYLKLSNWSF